MLRTQFKKSNSISKKNSKTKKKLKLNPATESKIILETFTFNIDRLADLLEKMYRKTARFVRS
jgi:hypothetical protein